MSRLVPRRPLPKIAYPPPRLTRSPGPRLRIPNTRGVFAHLRLLGPALVLGLVLGLGSCYSDKDLPAWPWARGPSWTVEQDPAGLGYHAGPTGGPQRFYPSAYSNPTVNAAGGPAR